MPSRLNSEVHDWNNEFLDVFMKFPVKLLLRERACLIRREKKTLLSLTHVVSF